MNDRTCGRARALWLAQRCASILFGVSMLSFAANAQTTVAGRIPGSLSVLPNGGASYRIPINAPSGSAPKLELAYVGRGDGTVGAGWILSGLSSVTRCPRTLAQDGARGAIRFNDDDRFCLDGQRLILISGTYGQDGAVYRAEFDIFSKVVSYGRSGNGPAWFKVWTKDGQIREYGHGGSTNVKVVPTLGSTVDPNTVREWDLNQTSDVSGNYMSVSNTSADVNRIDYGGNLISGSSHPNMLSFNYDSGKALDRFIGGTVTKTDRRLTTITVQQGGITIGKTSLTYESNPGSTTLNGRRLSSVGLCDSSNSLCMPATAFGYATLTGGFTAAAMPWTLPSGASSPAVGVATQMQTYGFGDTFEFGTPSVPATRTQTHVALVDMNGDGLADLYVTGYTPPAGASPEVIAPGQVYLNTGSGFSATATLWPLPPGVKAQKDVVQGKTIAMLIDLNGDGLPDLYRTLGPLVAGNPRGEVYLNTGSGFSSTPMPWALPASVATANVVMPDGSTQSALIDMDGDGLPDVYLTDGVNPATVYLNTGSGFATTPKAWPLPSGATSIANNYVPTQQLVVTYNDTTEYGTSSAPVVRTQTQIALIDMNADGLPDLVVTPAAPNKSTSYSKLVFFNTGAGFQQSASGYSISGAKVIKDVVNGFTLTTLIDMNGDGLPDVFSTLGPFAPGNPRGEVYISEGLTFRGAIPWGLPSSIAASGVVPANGAMQASLIDLDGDGFPDAFLTDGTNPAQAYLSNAAPLSRLTSVTSLTSPAITIDYAKLTDNSVYTVDTGGNAAVYPNVNLVAAKGVVKNVNVSNGIGGVSTTSYTYGGLKHELGFGRGPLGFRWMNAKDVASGVETYTEYLQGFPYTGVASKVETRLSGAGSGGVLKRTTNTWNCQNPQTASACTAASGNTYFRYLEAAVDDMWDISGTQYPSLTSGFVYGQNPQYGSPTQTSVTYSDGSSKTSSLEYWPADTTQWIFGRVKRNTVTSTQP